MTDRQQAFIRSLLDPEQFGHAVSPEIRNAAREALGMQTVDPQQGRPMNDVMIDLETMGTGADAAIVSIGAVLFDLETRQVGETFYCAVSLESAVESGGTIDAGTVVWWLSQDDAAREHITTGEHTSLAAALEDFASFLLTHDAREAWRVWGNGAAFDNVILAASYRRLGIKAPWNFWNDRCYRTYKSLAPEVPFARTGTHHNALDDAVSQARHAIAIAVALDGQQ